MGHMSDATRRIRRKRINGISLASVSDRATIKVTALCIDGRWGGVGVGG